MSEPYQDTLKTYENLMERIATDPDFQERLIRDPGGTLPEVGFTLPPDVKVKVVLDDETTMHLVIPILNRETEGTSFIC